MLLTILIICFAANLAFIGMCAYGTYAFGGLVVRAIRANDTAEAVLYCFATLLMASATALFCVLFWAML